MLIVFKFISPFNKETTNLMLLKISLVILSLVVFNFLLLFFSCNKTTKKANNSNNAPLKIIKQATIEQESENLSPTGS